MDRRERSGDMGAALLAYGEGLLSSVWTALPGIIQSFDPVARTCAVQPALQAQIAKQDGSKTWVSLPVLQDCPVQFPGGGGGLLTFPLKAGDECLVIFASRCIDAWWQSGGIQVQAELRMHDLSDGFCIPGISSVPNVAPSISTSYIEMRTVDGGAYVRIDPTTHDVTVGTSGKLNAAAVGDVTISSGGNASVGATGKLDVSCSGQLTLSGASVRVLASGGLTINGKDFATHHHSGVSTGSGQTGNVV